jgi:acetyltransferase-like isoleucine patch superfamily enzyme
MQQRLNHDWFSQPLPGNVRLGERTWLYSSYAFSHYRSRASVGVRVGTDTGLYHGTFFDLGSKAEIEIGSYCSLVGVIFATNGRVSIGDYTFIAHEVVIADSQWPVPIRDDVFQTHKCATLTNPNLIEVGRNVWIGAQAIVVGSVRIGEGAIIGAGTVVTRDVPSYTVCVGNPMRLLQSIPRDNTQCQ